MLNEVLKRCYLPNSLLKCAICRRYNGFVRKSSSHSYRYKDWRTFKGNLAVPWLQLERCHSKSSSDYVETIRNIGILAHVDGGKTTLTERMLFNAGIIKSVGSVDSGSTVTDFLEMERERGMTVNSAVVSFQWRPKVKTSALEASIGKKDEKYRINVIDTPGHVDFTIEVERSLRVLDGAIIVIDSSAGVQAQTATVWRQADRYSLPRIIFLNKLDKQNSNFEWAVSNVSENLPGIPLVCQIPVLDFNGSITSFVDAVNLVQYQWGDNIDYEGVELAPEDCSDEVKKAREDLLLTLADYDDELANIVLSDSFKPLEVDASIIARCIHAVCSKHACYPVVCGSALRNIGVRHCLDSVCHYLPSPAVKKLDDAGGSGLEIGVNNNELSAFVFKIFSGLDSQLKTVSYVRVYSGTLRAGETVKLANSGNLEKVDKRLFEPMGGLLNPVQQIKAGDIGVLTGLKHAKNGDTLVSKDSDSPGLRTFPVPKPVVYCSVEAESSNQVPKLEMALRALCREDPSLAILNDEHSPTAGFTQSNTVLGGMGELHFELVKHRLKKEFKLDVRLGDLYVHYRETVKKFAAQTETVKAVIQGIEHRIRVEANVKPLPLKMMRNFQCLHNFFFLNCLTNEEQFGEKQLKAIKNGLQDACQSGVLGHGAHSVMFTLKSVQMSESCSPAVIQSAITTCIRNALTKAGIVLMEPLMDIVVTTPDDLFSDLMNDVIARSGYIVNSESLRGNSTRLRFSAPLSRVLKYSSEMRLRFSGRVSLDSMQVGSYALQLE